MKTSIILKGILDQVSVKPDSIDLLTLVCKVVCATPTAAALRAVELINLHIVDAVRLAAQQAAQEEAHHG